MHIRHEMMVVGPQKDNQTSKMSKIDKSHTKYHKLQNNTKDKLKWNARINYGPNSLNSDYHCQDLICHFWAQFRDIFRWLDEFFLLSFHMSQFYNTVPLCQLSFVNFCNYFWHWLPFPRGIMSFWSDSVLRGRTAYRFYKKTALVPLEWAVGFFLFKNVDVIGFPSNS